MNIRLATIEDAVVLTAMGRDFLQYSEYRNIQVTDEQLQAGIAQIIAFECSFVAEMDGKVIGAILGVTALVCGSRQDRHRTSVVGGPGLSHHVGGHPAAQDV